MLEVRHCWGAVRAYFYDDDGSLCRVPLNWTSAAVADSFVEVSAGRSPFRIRDLLALSGLVASMRDTDHDC